VGRRRERRGGATIAWLDNPTQTNLNWGHGRRDACAMTQSPQIRLARNDTGIPIPKGTLVFLSDSVKPGVVFFVKVEPLKIPLAQFAKP